MQKRFLPITALLIMLCIVGTFARNQIWKDEARLWQDVVLKSVNKSRPHVRLGLALSSLHNLNEAEREYRIAINIDNDIHAHNNLGLLFKKQGRYQEALQAYLTAIKLAPEHVNAYNNAAVAYGMLGSYQEAESLLEHAKKLNRSDADIYNNLAVIYAKQKRYNEAIREFQIGLKLKPEDAQTLYNLGTVLSITGYREEAIRAFKAALNIQSDFSLAGQSLDQLGVRR